MSCDSRVDADTYPANICVSNEAEIFDIAHVRRDQVVVDF